jgi:hypothetical protein
VREAVIVIADLYLSGQPPDPAPSPPGSAPGLEHMGRFGERERLAGGWRAWLVRWLGREDLADVSVAGIAAASLAPDAAANPGVAGQRDAPAAPVSWMATPVELTAGLTRLHLDRRGIVRLPPGELAELAESFQRAFGGAGLRLQPLSDGNLLLTAPGIAPVGTAEPARYAGGVVSVPQGPAAAALLRLTAEIEMWLHTEPLNEARRRRGAAPVTGLWLWGAAGRGSAAACRDGGAATPRAPLAYGSDAFVSGLWHLNGGAAAPLPEPAASVFTDSRAERALLVVNVAAELPEAPAWSLGDALAALDGRLVRPALQALEEGRLAHLALVANDTRVRIGRYSALRRWRRRRPGLDAFA